jgi:hypothetical protein
VTCIVPAFVYPAMQPACCGPAAWQDVCAEAGASGEIARRCWATWVVEYVLVGHSSAARCSRRMTLVARSSPRPARA